MGLKRAFGYFEILCGKVLEPTLGVLLILDIFFLKQPVVTQQYFFESMGI